MRVVDCSLSAEGKSARQAVLAIMVGLSAPTCAAISAAVCSLASGSCSMSLVGWVFIASGG